MYSLVHDRELTLWDGTTLLRHDRFDALAAGLSEAEVAALRVRRVHPAFRIVALALPPTRAADWLSSEVLPLFAFHAVPGLDDAGAAALMRAAVPHIRGDTVSALLALSAALRADSAAAADVGSSGVAAAQQAQVCACAARLEGGSQCR